MADKDQPFVDDLAADGPRQRQLVRRIRRGAIRQEAAIALAPLVHGHIGGATAENLGGGSVEVQEVTVQIGHDDAVGNALQHSPENVGFEQRR